jgi:hypothetical protein
MNMDADRQTGMGGHKNNMGGNRKKFKFDKSWEQKKTHF